ncbi:hypothetical protein FGO68_gene4367 [Halteria grandinella]|uniref:Uncharacterized protein n=1 Tax=Halteria grandinella TaxID=5974 RepID=A0A8J8NW05_HALGN|nr:hypothetical protein FGO68_gene4367 [Halteria grandinella]
MYQPNSVKTLLKLRQPSFMEGEDDQEEPQPPIGKEEQKESIEIQQLPDQEPSISLEQRMHLQQQRDVHLSRPQSSSGGGALVRQRFSQTVTTGFGLRDPSLLAAQQLLSPKHKAITHKQSLEEQKVATTQEKEQSEEESDENTSDYEDLMRPQGDNFMTQLYANDAFLKLKESLTEELLENQEMINQIRIDTALIKDVDNELDSLKKWREEREAKKRQEKIQQIEFENEIIRVKREAAMGEDLEEIEVEQKYMDMMRRAQEDIVSIECLKIKKDNNAKDILNQQVHSKITAQLQQKEQLMSEVESKLQNMSLKSTANMDFYDNLESVTSRKGAGAQYLKQEALVRDFAEMEEQVSQFDQDMNDILALKPESRSSHYDSSEQSMIDSEIQTILDRIKKDGKSQSITAKATSNPKSKKQREENERDDKRINTLLIDIEKELQDIDDILKEVDDLRVGGGNAEYSVNEQYG